MSKIFNNIKCPANHIAQNLCKNKLCQYHVLVCTQDKCQYSIKHQDCQTISLSYLINRLNKQKISETQQYKYLMKQFQKKFEQIKKCLYEEDEYFNKWKSNLKLSQKQMQLLQLIKKGQYKQIKAKDVCQIQQSCQEQKKIDLKNLDMMKKNFELLDLLKDTLSKEIKNLYSSNHNNNMIQQNKDTNILLAIELIGFKNIDKSYDDIIFLRDLQISTQKIKNIDKQIQLLSNNIQNLRRNNDITINPIDLLKKLKQKLQIQKNTLNQIKTLPETFSYNYQNIIKQYSQKIKVHFQFLEIQTEQIIVINQYYFDLQKDIFLRKISNLFEKNIQLQILYKASLYQFNISHFWKYCQAKQNTLTVIMTDARKIIGAFTPIKWQKKKQDYKQDVSNSSFLFSLNQNLKFSLKEPQFATFHHGGYGPTFGGGYDLVIVNKANENANSLINLGNSYINNNVQVRSEAFFKKILGTNNCKFKILQWAVYEVRF